MRLNMYLIDWAIVPVWCSIFALGLKTGMIIMLPVMLIFAVLNALNAKKTITLMLTDINLMMASVAGVILNSLLFTRFIYADRMNVSAMMAAIFISLFYLTLIMIISMTVKDVRRRQRRRIINRLAYEDDGTDEDDKDDDYDEDDDFDDEDDEDDMSVERRMASRLLHKEAEGDEDEEDEEESPHNREPKFKVIKKK